MQFSQSIATFSLLFKLLQSLIYVIINNIAENKHKTEKLEIKTTVINNQNKQEMKVLKAIRILGDVAEIIVGASIVIELVERYRAKKKTPAPVLIDPADEPIKPAEVTTTENK